MNLRQRLRQVSSYTVWRIATVFAVLTAAGALLLAPVLFNRLDTAIDSNKAAIASNEKVTQATHDLTCAFADLVQLAPEPGPPHGSTANLEAQLHFLLVIRRANCAQIQRPVIMQTLNQGIRDLRAELASRGEPVR